MFFLAVKIWRGISVGRERYSLTTPKRRRGHNLKDDRLNTVQGKRACPFCGACLCYARFRVDTTSVAGLLQFIKQRGLEAHLHLLCNICFNYKEKNATAYDGLHIRHPTCFMLKAVFHSKKVIIKI